MKKCHTGSHFQGFITWLKNSGLLQAEVWYLWSLSEANLKLNYELEMLILFSNV